MGIRIRNTLPLEVLVTGLMEAEARPPTLLEAVLTLARDHEDIFLPRELANVRAFHVALSTFNDIQLCALIT